MTSPHFLVFSTAVCSSVIIGDILLRLDTGWCQCLIISSDIISSLNQAHLAPVGLLLYFNRCVLGLFTTICIHSRMRHMVFIALGLSSDSLISQPGHAETHSSFYFRTAASFSFKAFLMVFLFFSPRSNSIFIIER